MNRHVAAAILTPPCCNRSGKRKKEYVAMTLQRLSPKQFDRFSAYIYDSCGIRIDDNKTTLLSNRIRRRVKAGEFQDFEEYYRFLISPRGIQERQHFLDAVTTNETSFFRTQQHFDWLKNDWISEQVALARAGKRPTSLRLWSAGCANGAEPYTIAICLAENRFRLGDWDLEVVGTDLSQEMLERAKQGQYAPRCVETVTPQQRKRFFRHDEESDRLIVRDELKSLVSFSFHNLMNPIQQGPFDCIFIRNVLIYFDAESKQKVVANLLRALSPGGYLVIGPSEGIFDLLGGLKKVTPLIYQKTKSSTRSTPNQPESN